MPKIKKNPYKNVDFNKVNHYKASLHSHVRTDFNTEQEIVKLHEDYNFDIYSRTEKDQITNPTSEKMLIINGWERDAGVVEHSIVMFSEQVVDYQQAEQNGYIQWRAHPNDAGRPQYTVQQMAQHFKDYPESFIGLEYVTRSYQTGDGDAIHPHRRGEGALVRGGRIWNELIKDYDVIAYGLGVSDGYNIPNLIDVGETQYNCNWTTILSEEKTLEEIEKSMREGQFFFVSYLDPTKDIPIIDKIEENENIITVNVIGEYEKIYWLYDDEIVGEGNSFDVDDCPENQKYVRFEVWSKPSTYWEDKLTPEDPNESTFYSSNIIGSQPFFLESKLKKVFNKKRKIIKYMQSELIK